MLRVGRLRLRHHLGALLVLTLTATVALSVLGILRLLGAAVTDAAARSTVVAASAADRTISIRTSVNLEELPAAQAALAKVVAAQPGGDATQVFEPISRGLPGRASSDRANLAVITDLAAAVTVRQGELPIAGADPVQVALPSAAAAAGGWQVGDEVDLSNLIDGSAPTLKVRIAGLVEPVDPTDPIWLDLPLALSGASTAGSYTAYGPFLAAEGDLNRVAGDGVAVRWRIDRPITGVTWASSVRDREQAAHAIRLAGDEPALRGGQVSSQAPQVYAQARAVADRTRVALLTPTILLMVLGGVALTMAGLQLAALRAEETALIRARGAGSRQVAALSALDAATVALGALVLTLGVVALGSGPLARLGGLPADVRPSRSGLLAPGVFGPLLAAAGAVALLVLVTATRGGRLQVSSGRGSRSPLMQRLAQVGLDVVLLAFGLLGWLQLRRYDTTDPRIDPLTLAAPALLLAGLCVLGLRIVPVLARLAARAAAARPGLTLAWGSWQVARRLTGQSGAILLVFLSVAMGALALSQGATVTRAIADQTRFAVGAPMALTPGPEVRGQPDLLTRYARIAGSRERVMAVNETSGEIGGLQGVGVLAVDTLGAQAAYTPRADLRDSRSWPALLEQLRTPRVAGIPIPAGARQLEISAELEVSGRAFGDIFPVATTVQLALPTGERVQLRGPQINEFGTTRLRIALPESGDGWPAGGRVLALSAASGSPLASEVDRLTLRVAGAQAVTIDGRSVTGAEQPAAGTAGTVPAVFFDGGAGDSAGGGSAGGDSGTGGSGGGDGAVPALVTSAVARAARVAVGSEASLTVAGRPLPVRVVGILNAMPAANTPASAVLVDLDALASALTRPRTGSASLATSALANRWLLAPVDVAAARTALAEQPRLVAGALDTELLQRERAESPVNAGMRAALRLVTASALLLSALGFATGTAALALARHRESGILLALGTSPTQIRRAVIGERLVVLGISALVGLAIGILATWAIVALIIGGDGVAQVPPVQIVYGTWPLLTFVLAVVAILALVAVLVLGRATRSPSDVLGARQSR